jgi:hypothetical protein
MSTAFVSTVNGKNPRGGVPKYGSIGKNGMHAVMMMRAYASAPPNRFAAWKK